MLNELLEYKQYTFDLSGKNKDVVIRLKYSNLVCNGLTGVNRAMTTIARYFLFNKPNTSRIKTMQDRELEDQRITHILRVWCGFEKPTDDDDDEVKQLDEWLPKYIRKWLTASMLEVEPGVEKTDLDSLDNPGEADYINNLILSETNEEYKALCSQIKKAGLLEKKSNYIQKIANALDDLKSKDVEWSGQQFKIFSDKKTKKGGKPANNRNSITYERLIGNAIKRGPFVVYYLGCLHDMAGDCKKIGESQGEKSNGQMTASTKDFIRKLTAACMLKMTHYGVCQTQSSMLTLVSESDVVNWSEHQKYEKKRRDFLYYKNRHIFEQVKSEKNNNFLQIMLNQDWLTDSGWVILRGNEARLKFKAEHPDAIVYRDMGSGKPLEVDQSHH